MFYKVEIPEAVKKDIFNISDYIFRFSFSEEISTRVYNDIYKAIFSLDFLPYRYESIFNGFRRMIINWNYKVYYIVEEENKKVIIVRVFRCEQIDNF